MSKRPIKYDLISNAKDSLIHAVEHLTNPDGVKAGDLKRAIRDVSHVIELLLKEKLRRIHPAFMWQNIDKYPLKESNTVSLIRAVYRVTKLTNTPLSEESIITITRCKKFRDLIEHYEFQIVSKEATAIIGRMLAFIFNFSKRYLELDLEKEFKNDDRWSKLVEIYEFWEDHSKTVEKELEEKKIATCECPSCGAMTFIIDKSKCAICGHYENMVNCDECDDLVLESDIEEYEEVDYDEEGPCSCYIIKICKNCREKHEAEEAAMADYESYFDDIGD